MAVGIATRWLKLASVVPRNCWPLMAKIRRRDGHMIAAAAAAEAQRAEAERAGCKCRFGAIAMTVSGVAAAGWAGFVVAEVLIVGED